MSIFDTPLLFGGKKNILYMSECYKRRPALLCTQIHSYMILWQSDSRTWLETLPGYYKKSLQNHNVHLLPHHGSPTRLCQFSPKVGASPWLPDRVAFTWGRTLNMGALCRQMSARAPRKVERRCLACLEKKRKTAVLWSHHTIVFHIPRSCQFPRFQMMRAGSDFLGILRRSCCQGYQTT